MKIRTILGVTLCVLYMGTIHATPAQIILIRHGEKPKDPKAIGLSEKGKERAAALVPYFQERPEVRQYGDPVAIFAQWSDFQKHATRPIDTVKPLADALGLKVNYNFKRDDYASMVKFIKSNPAYDGKMVLVCWEHAHIPLIEKAAGVKQKTTFGKVFDRTRIITFDEDGEVESYEDLPQRLLFGDTQK